MKIRKSLVLGLVLVLLLGGVAATLPLEAPDPRGRTHEPFDVPVGRVGDKYVFGHFERNGTEGGWKALRTDVYVVDRIDTTLDAEGRHRDAVVLRSNVVDTKGTWTPGRLRPLAAASDDAALEEWIDLETRAAIRTDVHAVREGGYEKDSRRIHLATSAPTLAGLDAQGRPSVAVPGTPALAEDVTSLLAYDRASFAVTGAPTDIRRVIWATHFDASWVEPMAGAAAQVQAGGAGTVAGRAAVETVRIRSEPIPMDWSPPTPADDWKASFEGGQAVTETRLWFSADVPVPLLTEVILRGQTRNGTGATAGAFARTLADYVPGSAPIPWKDETTAPPAVVERSPGGSHVPADGADPGLPFPLGQALALAESEPGLLQLRAWRMVHPQAVLVSALLLRPESSDPGAAWHLWWAEPSGSAHGVVLERGSSAIRFIDRGDRTLKAFQLDDFPKQPVTFTQAHRHWKALAPGPAASAQPSYARWGYNLGVPEPVNPACGAASMITRPGELADLHRLYFGVTTLGPCDLRQDQAMESALLVDTGDGRPVGGYLLAFDYRPATPASNTRVTPPTVDAATQRAASLIVPSVERAALVTLPLLLVFLLVYFLPILKYLAAQAVSAVPGYSKLTKDRLLERKVRDELVEAIRAAPGIHASELGRRVDAGWGTVVHHLGVLERNQLVFSAIDGRHRRFWVVGEVDWGRRNELAITSNPTTKAVYDAIRAEPGAIHREIAHRVGVAPPNLGLHLRRLEAAGLVVREKSGRTVQYFPSKPYRAEDAVEVA